MASQIHFIVAKGSPSVSIGGGHKDVRPDEYTDGIKTGTRPLVKAVGSKGRAILHKLNTGEVTNEHPYSKKTKGYESTEMSYKGRHFMEDALSQTKGAVDDAIAKRYGRSFRSAINNINTSPIVRNYG